MTKFENSASKIFAGVAILLFLLAAYLAARGTWKFSTYERQDAVVTGFHEHKDGTRHPNLGFLYNGDTIRKRLDVPINHAEIGKSYQVIFPTGQPEEMDFPADLWWGSFIVACFGGLFLIPYVFLTGKKNVSTYEASGRLMTTLAGFAFLVPFIYTLVNLLTGVEPMSFDAWARCMMLGVFGVTVSGLSYFFWKHHLIRKSAEKWLEQNGVEIDASLTGIRTATTFNRARDGVVYSTELSYYLFCRWTRPSDNKTFHFRSLPYMGEFPYYKNACVKVVVDQQDPMKRYSVKLDFLSMDPGGISLIYTDRDQPPPVKIKGPFMDEAGTFFAFSGGIGFTTLAVFLIIQRLFDPTYQVEWAGLIVGLFLGLVFLLGAVSITQTKNILKKGKVIEAKYTGTENVGTERKRNTVYGIFVLNCEWTAPNGTVRKFTSETFRGESLYYNREKILVHLGSSRSYIVDVDFVSSSEKTGIKLEDTFPKATSDQVQGSSL